MLKIAFAILAGVLAVAAALFVWRMITTPFALSLVLPPQQIVGWLEDGIPFVIASAILVVAFFQVRAHAGWLAIVLLIGAIPLFIVRLHDFAISAAFDLNWFPGSFVFPNCAENPLITAPLSVLRFLSFCVPLALFGYVFRATKPSI